MPVRVTELRQKFTFLSTVGHQNYRLHGRRRERSSSATDRPYIHSPSFIQGQNVPACSMITKRVMINRTEVALYRNTCPLHVSYRHRLPVWTESFTGREGGARLGRIMMMEEKPPLHPLSEKQLHATSASLFSALWTLSMKQIPRKPAAV